MFFRKKYSMVFLDINPLTCGSREELQKEFERIIPSVCNMAVTKLRGRTFVAIRSKAVKKIQKDLDSPFVIKEVLEEGLTEKEVKKRLLG